LPRPARGDSPAKPTTTRCITEEGAGRLRGVFTVSRVTRPPPGVRSPRGSCFDSGRGDVPKAEALRQAVAGLPADRMLVERQSYLAPVRSRQAQRPAYITKVAGQLAAVEREPGAGDETDATTRLFRP
jgi:hypothetical protein